MASLYNIQQDILDIFNDIEAAGGEITEEQSNLLSIKQDELKTKLNNYVKAIKSWTADANACKDEKKCLNDRQNVYKNRIEQLKAAMIVAVQQFGEKGKTNEFVETATNRISTRYTAVYSVNEERANTLIRLWREFWDEVAANGAVVGGDGVDYRGIIDAINANYKAECELDQKEYIPFTISDLFTIKVSISETMSLANMITHDPGTIQYLYYHRMTAKVDNATTKDDCKISLGTYNDVTVANKEYSTSLIIK